MLARWPSLRLTGALLLTASPALALSASPVQDPANPVPASADAATDLKLRAEYTLLEDEYDDAYSEWRTAYREASSAHRELRKTQPDAPFDGPANVEPMFFPRFDRLAQAGSSHAKAWCLTNFKSDADEETQRRDFSRRALDLMLHPGADLSKMPRAIWGQARGSLGNASAKSMLHVLELVAEDKAVAAESGYVQAMLEAPDRKVTEEQAAARLAVYRRVAAAYPDQPYGKRAAGTIFKDDRLQIGMVAPDIVGKDVDGNDMKLSDFKGKVTVLDFWGFW